jgi:hypothetical protein
MGRVCVVHRCERRVDRVERADLSVGIRGDICSTADSDQPICAAMTWFGRFSFTFM